jgi:hypothetical protein
MHDTPKNGIALGWQRIEALTWSGPIRETQQTSLKTINNQLEAMLTCWGLIATDPMLTGR